MPDDFGSAFDAPLSETIGGREQRFPLLDLDDLGKLSAAARGRRKQRAIARLDPQEHDRIRNVSAWHDDQDVTVDDLVRYVGSADGSVESLVISLGREKVSRDDARRLALRLAREKGWVAVANLALRVATLFEQKLPNDQPSPGSESGSGGEPQEPS